MKDLGYMNKKDVKFDFDDILIEFEDTSDITSRFEIDYLTNNTLPLITAPMDTVISEENEEVFYKNKILTCMPRGTSSNFNGIESLSLQDFNLQYIVNTPEFSKKNILIDIANGHMKLLLDTVRMAKEKYGSKLFLVVGNVGTAGAYSKLSHAGADGIRIGVGNGNGCFLEGTRVMTNNGYKNIESIENGDFVLTHTKEFKEVIGNLKYLTDEKIYKINDIECTSNHEFYVINKKDINLISDDNYQKHAFWIEAGKIDVDNHFILEIDINA